MTQVANSLGWEVQQFSYEKGWTTASASFPDKADAYKELALFTVDGQQNFRVYESLS